MPGLDTNGWPIARGNWISCRASEIYLAVALPHHLVNAGKSDKLTNIHYNDKLDESPDLFTTSFASGGDRWRGRLLILIASLSIHVVSPLAWYICLLLLGKCSAITRTYAGTGVCRHCLRSREVDIFVVCIRAFYRHNILYSNCLHTVRI